MRVYINSYAYVLIKIAVMKPLIMTPDEYAMLKHIKDLPTLVSRVDEYFPGFKELDPNNLTLVDIENKLFEIYFKMYNKILAASPDYLQSILLTMLRRFEIWNIKTVIKGHLALMDPSEIKKEVLLEPERILGRDDFINKLMSRKSVEDVINYLMTTEYAGVITKGWDYYQKTREIFLLEALLDKFFYESLIGAGGKGTGFAVVGRYIDYMIERYNLMLIFRGLKSKVPKSLLEQLIIPKGKIIRKQILMNLLNASDTEDFYKRLITLLENDKIFRSFFVRQLRYASGDMPADFRTFISQLTPEDPVTPLLKILNYFKTGYYKTFIGQNLEQQTVHSVIWFLHTKQNDIYRILSLFVKIIHNVD